LGHGSYQLLDSEKDLVVTHVSMIRLRQAGSIWAHCLDEVWEGDKL